jgi:hypothetical protein
MVASVRVVLLSLAVSQVAGDAVQLSEKNFDKKVRHKSRSAFVKFLAPVSARALHHALNALSR